MPENVKDAVRKYVESKVNGDITSNDLGELLDLIRDTSLEELAKDTITKLSSTNPKLSEYFKYFTTSDKFGNINITYSGDSKAYTDALFKANAANLLKQLTTSEINIPIPGTNSSVGISRISSVFMGMDFLNNLQNENAGRAFTHTAATTAMTVVGVDMLTTGIVYASVGTGYVASGATILATAMASNPVGWSIAAGVAVAFVVGQAYKNNFLGIKTIANEMGDNIEKSVKEVENSIYSGIKSIQKVFGW
ncbi:hypothetical protein [Streptococcus sp. SM3]|uniref:hypothetical protein n=1 Tax=Streptococcus sp. SM3 TaxID=2898231 RepID=UPI0022B7782F|nr:hypothetical protein [Streptococcus sp. SM3]